MTSTLITNIKVVSENRQFLANVLIENDYIKQVEELIPGNPPQDYKAGQVIDGTGKYLLPGVIDDQVHFREPGLTHKGDIYTESRAAIAGGVTSYLEMPNTNPLTLDMAAIEEKCERAAEKSLANFGFYLGASNENLKNITSADPKKIAGIKVFMGSSTGNMLVDDPKVLSGIFAEAPCLIATHCEDEGIIRQNTDYYKQKYGTEIPASCHPLIRSEEACYRSSSMAAELATKYNSRLHILHLTSAREMSIFTNQPLAEKKITAEVCVHHLWFHDEDYETLGNRIKCNPAIKTLTDKLALREALINNKIDVVATDHAPHTIQEKSNPYLSAPSGLPLVQHSLAMMLEFYHHRMISLEEVVTKMCHAPANLFNIKDRGFIKPGYKADLVMVDLNQPWQVNTSNILYKCGWSPLEGQELKSKVLMTMVNGRIVYNNGQFEESVKGERLEYVR